MIFGTVCLVIAIRNAKLKMCILFQTILCNMYRNRLFCSYWVQSIVSLVSSVNPLVGFTVVDVIKCLNLRAVYVGGKRLWWSRGGMLAFSTQVCGFKPGRSRRIFRAKKPQHAFLRRGSKTVGPMP